ncbi:MAG: hypothetical protein GY806_19975, partial [Gammaproteobacteria bacterium]|nr:hypothetical protein [Gammaproteobacteria bacterium]
VISEGGRFLIALGSAGILDADIGIEAGTQASQWRQWVQEPLAVGAIYTIASSGDGYYLTSDEGVICWFRWNIINSNWGKARLGQTVPCLGNAGSRNVLIE